MLRKRKIIEQNAVLFERIEKLKRQIEKLNVKLKDANAEIERLNEEKSAAAEAVLDTATPIKKIEEKVILSAPEFNAADYGAKAIGKIVLSASEITSSLSGESGAGKIELVNLILGKAEVSKAEILNAVSSDISDKEKKMIIDSVVLKSREYFDKAISNN